MEGVPLLKNFFTTIFGPDQISESSIIRWSYEHDKQFKELEKRASQFMNYLSVLHKKQELTPKILQQMKQAAITKMELAGFPLPQPLPSTNLPEDMRFFESPEPPTNTMSDVQNHFRQLSAYDTDMEDWDVPLNPRRTIAWQWWEDRWNQIRRQDQSRSSADNLEAYIDWFMACYGSWNAEENDSSQAGDEEHAEEDDSSQAGDEEPTTDTEDAPTVLSARFAVSAPQL